MPEFSQALPALCPITHTSSPIPLDSMSAAPSNSLALVPPMIGGGEMGDLMRDTDWSSTALGDYRSWPASLRTALSLVLNTKGIAALYWGPAAVAALQRRLRPGTGRSASRRVRSPDAGGAHRHRPGAQPSSGTGACHRRWFLHREPVDDDAASRPTGRDRVDIQLLACAGRKRRL